LNLKKEAIYEKLLLFHCKWAFKLNFGKEVEVVTFVTLLVFARLKFIYPFISAVVRFYKHPFEIEFDNFS